MPRAGGHGGGRPPPEPANVAYRQNGRLRHGDGNPEGATVAGGAHVGHPLGITNAVTNGLDAKDTVIVTPPDGVQAGMTVKPVAAPKPKGA